MAKQKKKLSKDDQNVLNEFTQTIRGIDLKAKDLNAIGMINANGEFVHYKGIPATMNALPMSVFADKLEKAKKTGKLKLTREEFECFEEDTGIRGDDEGVTLPIEIEIIDESDEA